MRWLRKWGFLGLGLLRFDLGQFYFSRLTHRITFHTLHMDKSDKVELFCRLTLSNDVFLFGLHFPLALHILKSIAICIWSAVLFRGILGTSDSGDCRFVQLAHVFLSVSIVEGLGFAVAVVRWGWRVIHLIWKRSEVRRECRVELPRGKDAYCNDFKRDVEWWCCQFSSRRIMIVVDVVEHLFMVTSLCFLPGVVYLVYTGFPTSSTPEAVKWFPFLSAFAISYCVMDGTIVIVEGLYWAAQQVMLLWIFVGSYVAIIKNIGGPTLQTPGLMSCLTACAFLHGFTLMEKHVAKDLPDDEPEEIVVRCDKHLCCPRVVPVDAASPRD